MKSEEDLSRDLNTSCDIGATLFSILFIYLLHALNHERHFVNHRSRFFVSAPVVPQSETGFNRD